MLRRVKHLRKQHALKRSASTYATGMGSLNAERAFNMMAEMTRDKPRNVVGTDSLGGFLSASRVLSNELDMATLFTGEVERLAKKLNTAGGALLDYPTINDTATDAGLTAEAAAVTVQDMTFANAQLSAYNYASTSARFNAVATRQRIRFEFFPC